MNTNIFVYITMKRFIAGVKKKNIFFESSGIFEVSVVKYREVGVGGGLASHPSQSLILASQLLGRRPFC